MSVLYFIRHKTDKTQAYIGIDTPATEGYYPRAYEHVQSAYKTGKYQYADQFISKFGAYQFNFSVVDETTCYGLDKSKFELFSKYWKSTNDYRAMLSWAEVCWIYLYRNTFAHQNREWGGEDTFVYQTDVLKNALSKANLLGSKFGQELIKHVESKQITWKAHTLDDQNIYKLFWPEEYIIKDWIRTGLSNYLASTELLTESIIDSLKSLDGKTISNENTINLTKNIKDYFKKNLNPSNFKTELNALGTALGYSIDLSIDEAAIDQMAKALAVTFVIDRSTKEIRLGKTKSTDTIKNIFKTNFRQQRKNLPPWFAKGSPNLKGKSINDYVKQLTIQDSWRILSQYLSPVESAMDIDSLSDKVPFVSSLDDTDKPLLNNLVHDLKREALEGPIEVFKTEGEMWNVFGEGMIPFRRREWQNGKVWVKEKTYNLIKQTEAENLSNWTIW